MQHLNALQIAHVSGGQKVEIQEFYPDVIPGLQLIGWQQQIISWDTTTWTEKGWFFTYYHEEKTPIYEFTPIYS